MKDKARIWYALDVTVDAAATEAVESALNEIESLGTEIDSLRKAKGEPLVVTGFFDLEPDRDDLNTSVKNALEIYGFASDAVKSVVTRIVEETDWLAEWKKYWKPTDIGRFTITPPWETVPERDQIVISIEPNMAFGTGTHDTTQLCLKTIGELYERQQSFLDVGTGTGILAIAAAKLGGSEIFACDTDANSVTIAKENAASNNVGDLIEFAEGPIGQETPIFDFVCANLTVDVIVPLLPLLIAKSRSTLLLSGILIEQESIIVDELVRSQKPDFKIEHSGEWISVTVNIN